MLRCNGREAISILAEVEAGHKKLTYTEERYVRRQANGFYFWLINENNLSKAEAKETCEDLFNKDLALITQDDPFAEFIWSRGQDIGEMEIDIISAAAVDFEAMCNEEFKSYERSWNGMFTTADDGYARTEDEKYSPAAWKSSCDKLESVLDYVYMLKDRFEAKQLKESQFKMQLAKASARLNVIRFGITTTENGIKVTRGGGEVLYRHWAIATNVINDLRGVKARKYTVSVPKEDTDEESDALDHARHGENLDEMPVEEAA